MRAYSSDLRLRVLAACEDGMETGEAADTFAVSPSWVRRIRQRARAAGATAPRSAPAPGRPRRLAAADDSRLAAAVRDHPGQTAAEYRTRLGTTAARVTVWRALRRLGLTYKKSPSGRPSRTAPTWPGSGPTGPPP